MHSAITFDPVPDARAEAARYALLRRLAPSMRHHLVVNLQPIGMIYEVMERRLRAPRPDLADLQASAEKIHGFTRAALRSCLDVVGWLAPDGSAATSSLDGTRECAGLLATSLSFRGYTLRNEVDALEGEVGLAAMRTVLTAALVECTDRLAPPAEVVLSSRCLDSGLQLLVEARPAAGEEGSALPPAYRALDLEDVQALAAAEQVDELRPSPGRTVLEFPWVRPPAAWGLQSSSASTASISPGSSLAR